MTRFEAIQEFYSSLIEQAKLAERGKAPVPEIPETGELEFVDGWVVWNGHPVWHAATRALQDVKPRADVRQWRVAESVCLLALEQITARMREEVAALRQRKAKGITFGLEYEARVDAEQGYYMALADQARRAMRGQASIPDVPLRTELEFVDGWLVWKGRPVWWSGQRQGNARRTDVEQNGRAAEPGVAAPPPPSTARRKRRRLVPLPWRRAA